MKRVKAACLLQTLHFMPKDDADRETGAKMVREEVASYKLHLERTHTRYQILEENVQADGSMILKIKKQYNNQNCGEYMD